MRSIVGEVLSGRRTRNERKIKVHTYFEQDSAQVNACRKTDCVHCLSLDKMAQEMLCTDPTQRRALKKKFRSSSVRNMVSIRPAIPIQHAVSSNHIQWQKVNEKALRRRCTRVSSSLPGRAGQIINAILTAGFQISAIGTVSSSSFLHVTDLRCLSALQFSLDKVNAEEFLEVYKGVVHEYPVSCLDFSSFHRSVRSRNRKWSKN
jgi:hypothetical protein